MSSLCKDSPRAGCYDRDHIPTLPGMPAPTTIDDDAGDRAVSVDAEALAAEYDEERPSRRLSPRLDVVVNAWCFLVAVFVLRPVFSPLDLGNQCFLVYCLACTLPLAFLCYRARATRPPGDGGVVAAAVRKDDPGIVDWALGAVALLVGLYPVLPIPQTATGFGGFEGFLDLQGSLLTFDVVAGLSLTVLVREATRRPTGLVLAAGSRGVVA